MSEDKVDPFPFLLRHRVVDLLIGKTVELTACNVLVNWCPSHWLYVTVFRLGLPASWVSGSTLGVHEMTRTSNLE